MSLAQLITRYDSKEKSIVKKTVPIFYPHSLKNFAQSRFIPHVSTYIDLFINDNLTIVILLKCIFGTYTNVCKNYNPYQ